MSNRRDDKECPESSEEKLRWGYNLCIHPSIYDPSDDTYMILEYIDSHPELLKGSKVLEVGSGSGIISIHATLLGASQVVSIDISQIACEYTQLNAERTLGRGRAAIIETIRGDAAFALRNGISFDLIIINPPYLPSDRSTGDLMLDRALFGGASGADIAMEIIKSIYERVKNSYIVLIVLSSISELNSFLELLRSFSIAPSIVSEKSFFFEKLYLIEGRKVG